MFYCVFGGALNRQAAASWAGQLSSTQRKGAQHRPEQPGSHVQHLLSPPCCAARLQAQVASSNARATNLAQQALTSIK